MRKLIGLVVVGAMGLTLIGATAASLARRRRAQ